ncbi:MAG: POTRA domain-containing protein [Pyrinomonadaceae bacterium]
MNIENRRDNSTAAINFLSLRLRSFAFRCAGTGFLIALAFLSAFSQNKYEKHRIAKIDINVGTSAREMQLVEQYRLTVREAIGETYSTERIRNAIAALYDTKAIDTIVVAAQLDAAGEVELRFDIKRKTQAEKVTIIVGEAEGDSVKEQDLLFKLNLLTPGTAITEQTLRNNADQILDYLRDRGFYQSETVYERRPLETENEVGVTFRVTPNAQARVENFQINIEGLQKPILPTDLKLRKGGLYSRDRLQADLAKIRDLLRKEDFLAPELEEPRITFDGDSNTISIVVNGKVGPKVDVTVESERGKLARSTQTRLLPIKRDGTLDYAAIVEGARRLENYYQEKGYFFADVVPICSSKPLLTDNENNEIANETEFLCSFLGGEDLMGREVEVKYHVELNRRLTLTEIRVRGTDKLTIEDIRPVLGSQEASLLAIVPVLGYGRGYTSEAILRDDEATIRSLMYELGYQDADVQVSQGVTPDGENLIITFVIEEGIPTIVSDVSIAGNIDVPTDALMAELPSLTARTYSRARVRNAVKKLSEYYSNQGYYYARITSSIVESATVVGPDKREVKVEFKVENEGKKVVINRILINGNDSTKTAAVLRALTLKPGEFLRSADIYSSEQNLYGSDAFSRVDIKPQAAGDAPDGSRLTDLIVNVEEQPVRLLSYGG